MFSFGSSTAKSGVRSQASEIRGGHTTGFSPSTSDFPLSLSFRRFHRIATLFIMTNGRRYKESNLFFPQFTERLGRTLPLKRAARSVLRSVQFCCSCCSDMSLMDKVGTAFVHTSFETRPTVNKNPLNVATDPIRVAGCKMHLHGWMSAVQ